MVSVPVCGWGRELIVVLGMSVALSTRLGLHIDSSGLVEQGAMSPATHEARKAAFWAVFVIDRYAYQFIPFSAFNNTFVGCIRRLWVSTLCIADALSRHTVPLATHTTFSCLPTSN